MYNKLKLHCIKLTTIPKHLPVKSTTVPGTYQSQVASHMWVQWVRSVVSAFNGTHDNILFCVLRHHTATADSCQLTCTFRSTVARIMIGIVEAIVGECCSTVHALSLQRGRSQPYQICSTLRRPRVTFSTACSDSARNTTS